MDAAPRPSLDAQTGTWSQATTNVEGYITHNGDLEFFVLHGTTYPLEDMQAILPAVLHAPMTAGVDSMCVAGLFDLLRCKGMWGAAVRFGHLFGALKHARGNLAQQAAQFWSKPTHAAVTAVFEAAWAKTLKEATREPGADLVASQRKAMEAHVREALTAMPAAALPLLGTTQLNCPSMGRQHGQATQSMAGRPTAVLGAPREAAIGELARVASSGFFEMGLLEAGRLLMAQALGSFGLVLSHSLDATSELVVGSRGQTMSVAFYPQCGMVMFGSESAACKAGMGLVASADGKVAPSDAAQLGECVRLDMDDVNGEVVLLCWGPLATTAPPAGAAEMMRFGAGLLSALWARSHVEGTGMLQKSLERRVLHLTGNPLVQPIPPMGGADRVGTDIADIPKVLRRIKDDWNEPSQSLNRVTAFTLGRRLRKRLLAHADGTHDGSVDLLVVGCEVSLWVGEQFAADMHLVFPKLKIVCLSANKLLGQLGQARSESLAHAHSRESSTRTRSAHGTA